MATAGYDPASYRRTVLQRWELAREAAERALRFDPELECYVVIGVYHFQVNTDTVVFARS
jgi:hypothetical protein